MRRVCITKDGERIGIESIFTVNGEGKQINIPGKVEALRARSRKGELFCECGCQSIVTLVAGDKHLVKQHFRLKAGTGKKACTAAMETDHSFYSKVALKLWLEDKLKEAQLEARVALSRFDGSDRRFELTYYSAVYHTALCFWNERSNILSEKIAEIEKCMPGRCIYTVSSWNAGADGQYPEFLIKIQETQGYMAFLTIQEHDLDSIYQTAVLAIRVLAQNRHQTWNEIPVITSSLKSFTVSPSGELVYAGKPVRETAKEALNRFLREEARTASLEKKKAEEERTAYEERAKEIRKKREEEENRRNEKLAQWNHTIDRMIEERNAAAAKESSIEKARQEVQKVPSGQSADFENTKIPIYDEIGIRILKCRLCGKTGAAGEFPDAGYPTPGLGVCKECTRNGSLQKEISERLQKDQQSKKNWRCPKCGADLVKRQSRGRWFWGCSRYPSCKYTTNTIT